MRHLSRSRGKLEETSETRDKNFKNETKMTGGRTMETLEIDHVRE
jgi:hypothetical protein